MPKKSKSETNTRKRKNQASEFSTEKGATITRNKLKNSLENPEMRDQILRAIRTMLNEKQ